MHLELRNHAAKHQALREITQLYELQETRQIHLQWMYITFAQGSTFSPTYLALSCVLTTPSFRTYSHKK